MSFSGSSLSRCRSWAMIRLPTASSMGVPRKTIRSSRAGARVAALGLEARDLRRDHPRLQASQPVRGVHPQLVKEVKTVPKPTVEEIGARVRNGGPSPLGSGLYLVPADDRRFSEHGVPDPVGRERRLALGARRLGVGREGIRRLRRLRDAEQRHPRQLPVQATRAQTRAVSRRPLRSPRAITLGSTR